MLNKFSENVFTNVSHFFLSQKLPKVTPQKGQQLHFDLIFGHISQRVDSRLTQTQSYLLQKTNILGQMAVLICWVTPASINLH